MIKSSFKFLVFILVFLNFSHLIGYESKIVVKIDNEIVTNYDLKNKILTTLVLANEEINQENINKTKPLALKSLIDLRIKKIEIKKYKIDTTSNELHNNLKILAKNDIDGFKKIFQINNLDFDGYKEDLKIELAWRKLIYFLYKKKVNIEESEINNELNKLLEKNEEVLTEFRLNELIVTFDSVEDKIKKIKIINEQLKNSGFNKTLMKYNESLSKDNMGDLGWISSKSLSKNILDAIKDLKKNEISKPIILGNNILYLKLQDKRENNIKNKNINELKKQIINAKENQRFTLYSNSHLSKLKNLTTVEYK